VIGFNALLRREIRRFLIIWVQTILGPLTAAFIYELIFGYVFRNVSTGIEGVTYATFLVPGLIIMQVMINSFANTSSSLIQSKYNGNIVFLLMSPNSPALVILAYLVAAIVRGIVVAFAVFIGVCWFSSVMPYSFLISMFFLIIGAAICGGLGIIVGIVSVNFDQIAGFQSFIWTPLIYLSGIFYNVNSFAPLWRNLAYFDPILYIVEGFRYGFIGEATINLTFGTIYLLFLAVLINFIAYVLFKRGVKIKY
jgi:ABC-2 type transport system permease protein